MYDKSNVWSTSGIIKKYQSVHEKHIVISAERSVTFITQVRVFLCIMYTAC